MRRRRGIEEEEEEEEMCMKPMWDSRNSFR
jgi:hypothetical protein